MWPRTTDPRYDGVLGFVKVFGGSGPAPKQTVLNGKLPEDRMHGWKYLSFGPDGLLLHRSARLGTSPIAAIRTRRSSGLKPRGRRFRNLARGIRQLSRSDVASRYEGNVVYRTTDATTLRRSAERRTERGLEAGRAALRLSLLPPGRHPRSEFGKGKSCTDFTPPAQKMGPHVAALGLKFYTGTMFPPIESAVHHQSRFVEPFGPGRSPATASCAGQGSRQQGLELRAIRHGFLQKSGGAAVARQAWGQPVDLPELPDGSLRLDDRAGAIYRITYQK